MGNLKRCIYAGDWDGKKVKGESVGVRSGRE